MPAGQCHKRSLCGSYGLFPRPEEPRNLSIIYFSAFCRCFHASTRSIYPGSSNPPARRQTVFCKISMADTRNRKKTIFNFKYSESPVNTEFTRLSEKYPMRTTGLEPARRRHQNLNLARLPIPPCPQTFHGKHPLSMKKKSQTLKRICGLNEASGIRTPDNLIKSQVLYRLS